MTALIATIFVASVLGSLHCAGMCGAFVALTIGGAQGGRGEHVAAQVAYHGGRLVAYVLLGVAAGALGGALDLTGGVFRIQRAAIVLAGVAMIVFGVATLLRLHGRAVPRLRMPAPVRDAVARGYDRAVRLPPVRRALAIGLLSACLPCGWLYAFAAAAAGTGSAALGALAMAVFWAGTLPVLVSLGAGARLLAGPLGRHVPSATAVALVAVGVMALAGRLDVPALSAPAYAAPVLAPTGAPLEAVTTHVHGLDARDAPCCREENP